MIFNVKIQSIMLSLVSGLKYLMRFRFEYSIWTCYNRPMYLYCDRVISNQL